MPAPLAALEAGTCARRERGHVRWAPAAHRVERLPGEQPAHMREQQLVVRVLAEIAISQLGVDVPQDGRREPHDRDHAEVAPAGRERRRPGAERASLRRGPDVVGRATARRVPRAARAREHVGRLALRGVRAQERAPRGGGWRQPRLRAGVESTDRHVALEEPDVRVRLARAPHDHCHLTQARVVGREPTQCGARVATRGEDARERGLGVRDDARAVRRVPCGRRRQRVAQPLRALTSLVPEHREIVRLRARRAVHGDHAPCEAARVLMGDEYHRDRGGARGRRREQVQPWGWTCSCHKGSAPRRRHREVVRPFAANLIVETENVLSPPTPAAAHHPAGIIRQRSANSAHRPSSAPRGCRQQHARAGRARCAAAGGQRGPARAEASVLRRPRPPPHRSRHDLRRRCGPGRQPRHSAAAAAAGLAGGLAVGIAIRDAGRRDVAYARPPPVPHPRPAPHQQAAQRPGVQLDRQRAAQGRAQGAADGAALRVALQPGRGPAAPLEHAQADPRRRLPALHARVRHALQRHRRAGDGGQPGV